MLDKVLDNDFCIGCGNCVIVKPEKYRLNERQIAVKVIDPIGSFDDEVDDLEEICPFSGKSRDEDEINKSLFNDCKNKHPDIGYYDDVYIGWDRDDSKRIKSSSGGLGTHLIEKMLFEGQVSKAIVVSYNRSSDKEVEYIIYSKTDDLEKSRQSKYTLVSYANLSKEILSIDEEFVFVGIPCHVKSMRLLASKYSNIQNNLKFAIAVFCGHQKTNNFNKFISWQMGIHPEKAKSFTYRVKKDNHKAHEYYYSTEDDKKQKYEKCVTDLEWLDWGLGLFKYKACDFCDDVAAETADMILGDAWIKPYTSNYLGTNVLIVRNKDINDLLVSSKEKSEIELIDSDLNAIFDSQGANFRHRKEGLLSRMALYNDNSYWYPTRRKSLNFNHAINTKRHDLYCLRHSISSLSNESFEAALKASDIEAFYTQMRPSISRYYSLLNTPWLRVKKHLKKALKVFL